MIVGQCPACNMIYGVGPDGRNRIAFKLCVSCAGKMTRDPAIRTLSTLSTVLKKTSLVA